MLMGGGGRVCDQGKRCTGALREEVVSEWPAERRIKSTNPYSMSRRTMREYAVPTLQLQQDRMQLLQSATSSLECRDVKPSSASCALFALSPALPSNTAEPQRCGLRTLLCLTAPLSPVVQLVRTSG